MGGLFAKIMRLLLRGAVRQISRYSIGLDVLTISFVQSTSQTHMELVSIRVREVYGWLRANRWPRSSQNADVPDFNQPSRSPVSVAIDRCKLTPP